MVQSLFARNINCNSPGLRFWGRNIFLLVFEGGGGGGSGRSGDGGEAIYFVIHDIRLLAGDAGPV